MTSSPVGTDIDFKPLSGPDKVAALLLAMGKPLAGRLLKHFDAVELKQITRSAAELGSVPVHALETLIEEFAGQFSAGADLFGTAEEVQRLLTGVLTPEQIEEIMSDILGNSNRSMWDRISALPETLIAEYLTHEHPQTGALILSRVTPACAAKIIAHLPRDLRNALMRRMLGLKPVTEAAIRIIEAKLNDDLLVVAARNTGPGPNARMAEIINKMQPRQMEEVLQSLAEVRPKETELLKKLLFTFEDLVKLPAKSRMVLFDKIPTEKVVLALKGTNPDFRDFVLSSLASRAKRLVETELNGGAASPQRDILAARRTISDLVLQLAEKGEIDIQSPDEEEEET